MADFPPIQEGDALSPAALDAKFDVLEEAVNKVETVAPKTFDHYHGTPSLIEPLVDYGTGARFMGHAGHHHSDRGSEDEYKHSYWLAPDRDNAAYRGFGSSQMAIRNVQKGWKVIGSNLDTNLSGAAVQGRSDGQLECTFSSPIGLVDGKSTRVPTLDRVGGILVLLNLEVLYFTGASGVPRPLGTVETTTVGQVGDEEDVEYSYVGTTIMKVRAHFGIQVKVKSGTNSEWYNVKKSNRALSMPSSGRWSDLRHTVGDKWACGLATSSHTPVRGSLWKDISIRTLITRDDLDTVGLAQLPDSYTDMVVEGVRAVICIEDGNDTDAGDLWSNADGGMVSVALKAYSMTTLALGSDYTSEGF